MKNKLILNTLTGYFLLHKLFRKSQLIKNIQKNEGYRNKAYKDKLGNLTIGYGHLINKSEKHLLKKKQNKQSLKNIFYNDLNHAIKNFKDYYKTTDMPNNVQEVIIEMIYQLGIKTVLRFKKFNIYIKKKKYYLAAIEMIDSRWNKQTPKRVQKLISILLKYND